MIEISLPSFEEMAVLVENIKKLSYDRAILDVKIKVAEANVFLEANNNEKYFQNGKPPSVAFVERTWGYTGFEKELIPLREQLAEVSSALESSKLKFDAMKLAIEIWRTSSANERSVSL